MKPNEANPDNVVLVNHLIRKSRKPNAHRLRIPIRSNWNLDALEKLLVNCHNKEIVDYLRYGWPIGHDGRATDTKIPFNQKRAKDNPEALFHYIEKEQQYHAVAEGFDHPPFRASKISPLDTRKKRDSSELRVILNLSHPYSGGSANEGIPKNNYLGKDIELHYPKVDNLVAKIIEKKEETQEKNVCSLKKISKEHTGG